MQVVKSKNKIQNSLTLKHAYQYYIKDIDKESKYHVEAKTYRSICEDFNKMLMTDIVEEGEFFHIPYRLGVLRIKKRKIDLNNLKPNFSLYNQTGVKTKFLNEHSGGFYCRFYWNKASVIVKNKFAYSFIPTRFNKRYLAHQIKELGRTQINKYFE